MQSLSRHVRGAYLGWTMIARKRSGWTPFLEAARIFYQRPPDARMLLGLGGMVASLRLTKEEEEEVPGGKEKARYLEDTFKKALAAAETEDFEKSEELLQLCLTLCQEMKHERGITHTYNALANVAYERGEYEKAETLFKSYLKRMVLVDGHKPEDNVFVETSLKLANIYAKWGRYPEAEAGFTFCLNAQKAKLKTGVRDPDTFTLLGMAHEYYAKFMMRMDRPYVAYEHFHIAYLICREVFGERHEQTVVLMNSLGAALSASNNLDEAAVYFQRALSLAKSTGRTNVYTYIINLGIVRLRQGNPQEALKVCQEGYELARKNNDKMGVEKAEECITSAKQRIKGPQSDR